ncbi:MAG TPA: ABC transporter ATP-binding protein [Chthonomonadaceae bacterium]|nr:ABC transporter ATP-binding protein [Chthonomonadaceae bacterium]
MPSDRAPLVEVENLRVRFATDDGVIDAVSDVSFTIPQSGAVGLVGESGCGKSMTGLSLLQLVPPPGRIDGGAIRYHRIAHAGAPCKVVDIAALPPRGDTVRSIRGAEIAMIFQEPMSSLNPVYTIGSQIAEMVRTHEEASAREARARAIEMLRRVGIPDPEQRVDAYPHQLSGGMRQRAMIAMALVCRPRMLIADEPTTALDVTVQAQILDLMRSLQEELGMAILIISHDLGVIADLAETVVVMYAGKVVEEGPAQEIFDSPQHPYTRGLLRAAPVMGQPSQNRLYSIPGTVPHPLAMPRGCAYRPRCPERLARCIEPPALKPTAAGHLARCWAREAEARG